MLRLTRNDPQKSRCIVSYASKPSAAWHHQPQYGRNSWDQGLTGGTLHLKREKDQLDMQKLANKWERMKDPQHRELME